MRHQKPRPGGAGEVASTERLSQCVSSVAETASNSHSGGDRSTKAYCAGAMNFLKLRRSSLWASGGHPGFAGCGWAVAGSRLESVTRTTCKIGTQLWKHAVGSGALFGSLRAFLERCASTSVRGKRCGCRPEHWRRGETQNRTACNTEGVSPSRTAAGCRSAQNSNRCRAKQIQANPVAQCPRQFGDM